MRQALNRPLYQHVSARYTHTIVVLDTAWPWASEAHKPIRARSYGLIVLQVVGPMTLTGFAVRARTFVRINLYAQDHTLLFPK